MHYTIEHLVASFFAGLIVGVVSTVFFSRKDLTLEMTVALLIMSVWMGMHVYGFFFATEVDWFFNIAGFGAVGTFVGINLRAAANIPDTLKILWKK